MHVYESPRSMCDGTSASRHHQQDRFISNQSDIDNGRNSDNLLDNTDANTEPGGPRQQSDI